MNEGCERFQAMLPDYRWLGPRERAPLDRHLTACARCREEWREAQAADDLFTEARTPAPQGFADGVMSALEQKPQSAPANWLWPVLAGALAVEVAVAVALRINPTPWWQAATAFCGQLVNEWSAPLSGWTLPFGPTFWAGALLLVSAFGWLTLNHRRTEHA